MNYTIAQADPWQKYENQGKKKPGIPEPATYGVLFCLLCLALYIKHTKKK